MSATINRTSTATVAQACFCGQTHEWRLYLLRGPTKRFWLKSGTNLLTQTILVLLLLRLVYILCSGYTRYKSGHHKSSDLTSDVLYWAFQICYLPNLYTLLIINRWNVTLYVRTLGSCCIRRPWWISLYFKSNVIYLLVLQVTSL